MTTPLGPGTLPANDNVNAYSFNIALNGSWFMRKGAMIAYYGQMRFEALTSVGSLTGMVAKQFSSPLYTREWVVATGQGQLMIADRGLDVNSLDLEDGNLTVRASNLLAFTPELQLKQSIVPGFLTLIGTGTFLASSNGPVIFAEPPLRVDPQALVGWADCPSPSHHYDAGWMGDFLGAAGAVFGRTSGEERQFDFTGAGTVLLQSSEVVVEDPALLAQITDQTNLLGTGQVQSLLTTLQARVSGQQ
ncbi:MAG: hypothetical protein JWL64_933 [Frankiales bacterium]|nr:hypothetical protein [Frankiales bacterium]